MKSWRGADQIVVTEYNDGEGDALAKDFNKYGKVIAQLFLNAEGNSTFEKGKEEFDFFVPRQGLLDH